ncbi:MAG TPA: hypothetical protein VJ986_07725 [Gaiellaceae bacterium]|nr:hypothetical protein [Gaiellaceae bacterium]
MLRLASFLRLPMSFLFARSAKEERVAEYVIREHHSGRNLEEILKDHFVQNRLSPQQQARCLERQDVIEAVGRDDVDAARGYLARISGDSGS